MTQRSYTQMLAQQAAEESPDFLDDPLGWATDTIGGGVGDFLGMIPDEEQAMGADDFEQWLDNQMAQPPANGGGGAFPPMPQPGGQPGGGGGAFPPMPQPGGGMTPQAGGPLAPSNPNPLQPYDPSTPQVAGLITNIAGRLINMGLGSQALAALARKLLGHSTGTEITGQCASIMSDQLTEPMKDAVHQFICGMKAPMGLSRQGQQVFLAIQLAVAGQDPVANKNSCGCG